MHDSMEMLTEREGEVIHLLSPGVGEFTCAVGPGGLLGPGQNAGRLIAAGRAVNLIVPAGITGRVTNNLPDRVHAPMGYGSELYVLAPISAGLEELVAEDEAESDSGLVLRASQTGRFYHRSSPDEPAFVQVGDTISEGATIGLLEIMKTFNQVNYRVQGSLPARAKVVRLVAGDGMEIRAGDALLEVEPA